MTEDLAATLRAVPLKLYAAIVDRHPTEVLQHLAVLFVHVDDPHLKSPPLDLVEVLRAMHAHLDRCRW